MIDFFLLILQDVDSDVLPFPQWNKWSTPLAILVLQGLIFAFLLIKRYCSKKKDADLIIGLILLIMAFHRTTYTIGFMGWYDNFTNTKINYYLISLGLAFGPLVYLYVRTTLQAPFKLKRIDWLHFIPVCIYIIYKLVLLMHDSSQEGWENGYSGEWKSAIDEEYVSPIVNILTYTSQLLYLALTGQLFWRYSSKIKQYFSSSYKVELNWLKHFLIVYIFLFFYGYATDLIDAFVTPLDYIHRWWWHLFSAIAIVYLGIKAYFTDLDALHNLTFEMVSPETAVKPEVQRDYSKGKSRLESFIVDSTAYLDPDLTLRQLSSEVGMSLHDLSEVINNGYGVNFNEFINRYRVEEVKRRLLDDQFEHLSLVALAMDCGFNSKATFNRVFKKLVGQSPSEYKSEHKNSS